MGWELARAAAAAPPEEWYKRVNADRRNSEMWFRGNTYTFPELVEERGGEHFKKELDDEKGSGSSTPASAPSSGSRETLDVPSRTSA